MRGWYDQDDFWAVIEPVMLHPSRTGAAPAQIDALLRLPGVPLAGDALDVGCGAGHHARALAGRGFRVTGLDRTARYLERARVMAPACEWVLADALDFVRPDAFDLAVSLYTSLGYLDDDAGHQRLLANVAASLRPGGAFVVDVLGKECFARQPPIRTWREHDGVLVLEERLVRDGYRWLDSRWIVVRDGKRHDLRGVQRLWSAGELEDLLLAAGFATVRSFGGFDGRPYDDRADHLVVVARRAVG